MPARSARALAFLSPAALLSCLALACRKAAPAASQEPHQVLEDFNLSQSYRGSPSWDLRARTAVLKENSSQASLTSPQMAFYRKGRIASRLSALTGSVRTDTHDVRLSSSVVVTSLEDHSVLRTEELEYSSQKRKFFTDKEVMVKRPGGFLRGRGLEAEPDLSEIRIFNQTALIEERKR